MSESLQEPELTASNFFNRMDIVPPEQFVLEWHRGTCLKSEIGLGHHIESGDWDAIHEQKKMYGEGFRGRRSKAAVDDMRLMSLQSEEAGGEQVRKGLGHGWLNHPRTRITRYLVVGLKLIRLIMWCSAMLC